jgi:general secretion pathway protein C
MDLRPTYEALKAQSANQWLSQANQYLPNAFTWIFLIAITWCLARLVWALVPTEIDFDWRAPSAYNNSEAYSSGTAQIDFTAIANAHLFGQADAEPLANQAIDAPETQLDLKLRGAIAAGDEAIAHAIISDGNSSDKVYFIKDTVPGGALLHEVYPDRVILNRAGILETLRLPRVSESQGMSMPSLPQSAAPDTMDSGMAVQQMMQGDPSSFTDILRPQPYMPNGELKGYRVYPGRDRRRFAALGLRPGDLITDINGQALNNLQGGMEVFRSLGSAPQIAVTIERNGSPMTLTLDTNQVIEQQGLEE